MDRESLCFRKFQKEELEIMAKLYKLQVELSPTQFEVLNELQEAGDLRTKKELLDNALTFLKWGVRQKQDGNLIISTNPQTGAVRELEFPYLQRVAEKRRAAVDHTVEETAAERVTT